MNTPLLVIPETNIIEVPLITSAKGTFCEHNQLSCKILCPWTVKVFYEDGIEKISRSLFDAAVDLTPPPDWSSTFCLKIPLSKGVILADAVGLGKTIEASIALCQYWAERKRKLLIICPASIRKQWSIELEEKFNIPSVILEAKTYHQYIDQGYDNPFAQGIVVICSY